MKEQTTFQLMELGLSKNESRVYLALLGLGPATAIEIARSAKVHRVNVYDVLERLREKGLISSLQKEKKQIFSATNPTQLQTLLEQKQKILQGVLPTLEQEFALTKEQKQVFQFFGPEGVLRAYYMMLEQNSTIYGLGGSGLNRKYLRHRHEQWNEERKRRKIKGKVIYYESSREDKASGWNDKSMQIRYLSNKYKSQAMVDVCGDLVINLLPIEDEIMAIVIENKTLAESYKQFFRIIWEQANKN
ncbi:hypothetical protein CL619_01545 [archaeon]|nr:hypothetical protein [archaeon]